MPFMDNCEIQATYDVGAAGGNREDLLDIITNISPNETPLFSGFRKTVAAATLHEWMVDNLTSPGDPEDATYGQEHDVHCTPEASDADFDHLPVRCRLNNRVHIFRKTYDVSDLQRAVKVAGVSDEFTYQASRAAKELALMIEYALLWSNRAVQTADQHPGDCTQDSGCWRMDGLRRAADWGTRDFECLSEDMQGSILDATGPGSDGPSELTPEILDDLNELGWTKGASFKNIYVGAYQKRKISSFCLDCTAKTMVAADKKMVNAIDVYESDFGLRRVNLHRYMNSRELLMLDEDYMAIAFIQAIKAEILARVGNSTKGMIEGVLTLEVRTPAAIGLIINLTNAATEE